MEKSISVLIVEDEEIWVQNLQSILEDLGYTVAGTASTLEAALKAIDTVSFDIALLDIHLNGQDTGIALGSILRRLHARPFIFITAASKDHSMQDAVEAGPSAYLIKPVNESSLFIAIQNAIHNFSNDVIATPNRENQDLSCFFVKHGNRYRKVEWKDIVYLSAGKNYITAFNAADKCEYYIRGSLQSILRDTVPDALRSDFVQVNRADVVQFSFIQEVMPDEVRTEFRTFPLSETLNKELRKRMKIV